MNLVLWVGIKDECDWMSAVFVERKNKVMDNAKETGKKVDIVDVHWWMKNQFSLRGCE